MPLFASVGRPVMHGAAPLSLAAAGLALALAVRPAPAPAPGIVVCAAAPGPVAARDWLGSLQGWPDSALVRAWSGFVAMTKGRPQACP